MSSLPLIVLGGGGHARVLIETLQLGARDIIGIAAPEATSTEQGVPYLGPDEVVSQYNPGDIELVNGIGSVGKVDLRASIFSAYKSRGYIFASVVHPSAVIAADVKGSEGMQVLAGAVIQTGTSLGANVIINTGATVDHDCRLEQHVHVAPGATLSGGVKIGERSLVGAGATVIQNIEVGVGVVIGAGAAVVDNIADDCTVVGVPARGPVE